jgi:transcriptional regulator with XRE-family HTH domain
LGLISCPPNPNRKEFEFDSMLESAQIRAARALLGWKQENLANAAKVGVATIRRIEGQEGPMMGYVSTLMRIQSAFEDAGVRFLDKDSEGGIGVRLAR